MQDERADDRGLLEQISRRKWLPARGISLREGDRVRIPWPKADAVLTGNSEMDWREGTMAYVGDPGRGRLRLRLDIGGAPLDPAKSTAQVLR